MGGVGLAGCRVRPVAGSYLYWCPRGPGMLGMARVANEHMGMSAVWGVTVVGAR